MTTECVSAREMERGWLGRHGDPADIPARGWNQRDEPTDEEEAAVPPYHRDLDGYDDLTERLAENFTEREHDRPSDYASASAFIRAASHPHVAGLSSPAAPLGLGGNQAEHTLDVPGREPSPRGPAVEDTEDVGGARRSPRAA